VAREYRSEPARAGIRFIVAGRLVSPVFWPDTPQLMPQALDPDAFGELAHQLLLNSLRGHPPQEASPKKKPPKKKPPKSDSRGTGGGGVHDRVSDVTVVTTIPAVSRHLDTSRAVGHPAHPAG
jgi:hypothetical protein